MAAANFNELKSVVIKSLESSGVLAQIRTQLRASIFKAIDRKDDGSCLDDGSGGSLICEVPHAALSAELVSEFFEFHGLRHSLCVFQMEAQLGVGGPALRRGREDVAADSGLGPPVGGCSVLEQLVGCHRAQKPEREGSVNHLDQKSSSELSVGGKPASAPRNERADATANSDDVDAHTTAVATAPASAAAAAATSSPDAVGGSEAPPQPPPPLAPEASSSSAPAMGGPNAAATSGPATRAAAVVASSDKLLEGTKLPGAKGPHMRLPPLGSESPTAAASGGPTASSGRGLGRDSSTGELPAAPPTPLQRASFGSASSTAGATAEQLLSSSTAPSALVPTSPSSCSTATPTATAPGGCGSGSCAAVAASTVPAVALEPAKVGIGAAGSVHTGSPPAVSGSMEAPFGLLPKPSSPHGPLPPILGSLTSPSSTSEHAGGSGVAAARAALGRGGAKQRRATREVKRPTELSDSADLEASTQAPTPIGGGTPVAPSSVASATVTPVSAAAPSRLDDNSVHEISDEDLPMGSSSDDGSIHVGLAGEAATTPTATRSAVPPVSSGVPLASTSPCTIGAGVWQADDVKSGTNAIAAETERSLASVFDSTAGIPDMSAESIQLEKLDHFENIAFRG